MNILASLLVINKDTHALNVRYATDTTDIFLISTSVLYNQNNRFIYEILLLKDLLLE